MKLYPESDLEEISLLSKDFQKVYSNKSLLIAGSTGFVGRWIIAALDYFNRVNDMNVEIIGISRRVPTEVQATFKNVRFIEADLSDDALSSTPYADCVFNAVTPSTASHGGQDVNQVLKASIDGTNNLIKLASQHGSVKFINLSSGIVSKRANDVELNLREVKDAYLQGKRISEDLVLKASAAGHISGTNARLFAFAGPGIPLEEHFAIGNFVNDAIKERHIQINGNPGTIRSYMYPTDLVANILRLATVDSHRTLEIGSMQSIRMDDLAKTVLRVFNAPGILQNMTYGAEDIYLPMREQNELICNIDIEEILHRWKRWLID